MVKTRKSFTSGGTELLCDGVEQFGVQTGRSGFLVFDRPPEGQNSTGGQDDCIQLDPPLGHRSRVLLPRSGSPQIDDLSSIGRRIPTTQDHLARVVTVVRCEWKQDGGAIAAIAAVVGGGDVQC